MATKTEVTPSVPIELQAMNTRDELQMFFLQEDNRKKLEPLCRGEKSYDGILRGFLLAVQRAVEIDGRVKNCTKLSFFTALHEALTLGLSLNPSAGQAYLIPYGNKITFAPSYSGIEQMVRKANPDISHFTAHVVYQEEVDAGHFRMWNDGGQERVCHEYALAPEKPNDIVAAYTRVEYKDGRSQIAGFLTKGEIEMVMESAKHGKGSLPPAWSWRAVMVGKASLRRALKHFTLTPELEKWIELYDEQSDVEDSRRMVNVTPGAGGRAAALAGRLTGKTETPDEPGPSGLPVPRSDGQPWGDSPQE